MVKYILIGDPEMGQSQQLTRELVGVAVDAAQPPASLYRQVGLKLRPGLFAEFQLYCSWYLSKIVERLESFVKSHTLI